MNIREKSRKEIEKERKKKLQINKEKKKSPIGGTSERNIEKN